ncbi:MAG: class I SAM-dependent methyltransferase [Gammaproteobacteria bacterium]|nr:class I SAM-dependent methyltransferase [Gammaproteobacteria bacterium]
MNHKPIAPATERNKQSILGVIREEFRELESILEIGSGTGQHAAHFAAELDHLTWQTSDLEENHAGIRAWLRDAALGNIREPVVLDVLTDRVPDRNYDGVFSANTAHIMSFKAVEKMFSLVSAVLSDGGVFILYGPFRQDGEFNTASNAEFHRSLRQRDPDMGIRHLEDLDRLAEAGGMRRMRLYAMPANNHIVAWVKKNGRNEQ